MAEKSVFDTSSLKELDTDKIIVPNQVEDEADRINAPTGLVGRVESISVDTGCVNDVITDDVRKSSRQLGTGERRDLAQKLEQANRQGGEHQRQILLQQAWNDLGDAAPKSWNGEKSGAKTDCAVLTLVDEENADSLFSEDSTILEKCEDDLPRVSCRSISR